MNIHYDIEGIPKPSRYIWREFIINWTQIKHRDG